MIDYDFSFYLSLATFVAGIVWLLDIFLLAPKRSSAGYADTSVEPWYVEYAKSFFPVLLFVLILRSFIAEPFRIPSGSMIPTLEVGDFILVNKFSYGLRLPVLNSKFISFNDPERGDVIVFRYPKNPKLDYIKRVVGLPGDHIKYEDKQLFINGSLIENEFVSPYTGSDKRGARSARIYTEKLPNKPHNVLINPFVVSRGADQVVPKGHYFVMGDNRDDSLDSRFWGFLPEENLVGKAFFVWMHYDFSGEGFSWNRVGTSIQ